jgi:galactokinase
LTDEFRRLFGRAPDVVTSAPGRVNLIGEHTDYNDGFVLPAAIPRRTHVELALRDDDRVRVASREVRGRPLEYRLGEEQRRGRWLDYVQGITHVLADRPLRGFDLHLRSDVPLGSGLSSSAALEVGLLRGLREALALELDDVAVALLAHRAETQFVGAPVGVMDPFAVHFADETHALLLDTRSLEIDRIALPSGLGLIVIDSGVHHRLAAQGGYRTRRDECERAAAQLGVPSLRELGEQADAHERAAGLPEPLSRRVRHVLTENARVLASVRALRAGDGEQLGRLFLESHQSMRDDYEVSVPEVDALVEVAAADPGVYGARLTGGGFGGSVVVAARGEAGSAQLADTAARIAGAHARAGGRAARVLVPALDLA